MNDVLIGLMLLVLGVAVYFDLTARRIPNAVTIPGALCGLAGGVVLGGLEGLGLAMLGWLAGAALLIVPFLLRGIGAGDVKLLAAVGALQGPLFAVTSLLYGAIAAGVVTLLLLRHSGQLGMAVQSLVLLRFLPNSMGAVVASGRVPYAPAIALGAVVSLALGVGR